MSIRALVETECVVGISINILTSCKSSVYKSSDLEVILNRVLMLPFQCPQAARLFRAQGHWQKADQSLYI